MDLGNKILELRKKARLSQEQLAEKMNVTRQTILNWELGQTNPDISQATELSKIFKITLDELVGNNTQNILEMKVNKIDNNIYKSNILLKIIFVIVLIIMGITLSFVFSKYLF